MIQHEKSMNEMQLIYTHRGVVVVAFFIIITSDIDLEKFSHDSAPNC